LRGVLVDITDRKKMEAQLAESQRLAAIGETASMVGHDLRNPLQATTTTLYLAKKMLSSGTAEEKDEALGLLEELDNQVYYMDKVISDLQHYANPVDAELTETNLPELIGEVFSTVKIPPNVQVSTVVQGDLGRIMANPPQLRRVLLNLIMNAIQAMPEGGALTVTASTTPDSAIITVQDTGVGIPAENMQKIFSPFFTTKAQGQGLGLAVCKRLIAAQNGAITAKSEPGKGSTFTVKLPLKS
jgi:signal transduction histidine kinase